MPATHAHIDVIEGAFTVVATRELPAERPFNRSPNRQRLAARIVFWNFALAALVVGLPIVF